MSEPGVAAARPTEWGPKLTNDWWLKTSDALLRRLVGFGAGDGPDQDQTQRLSQGVQIIFGAPQSADFGEQKVRIFLKSSNESSDTLYIALCDALVEKCGPLLARQLGETEEAESDEAPVSSAAVGLPRNVAGRSPQTGTEIVRPTPKKKRPDDSTDWWQEYIDRQHASFDREHENREVIYQTCLEGLTERQGKEFSAIAAVHPDPLQWRTLFNRALDIARLATGIPGQDDDDAYHHYDLPSVPPSLRSYWLLGELVHAQWQFEYMHAELHHDILAEYLFTRGASTKQPDPVRGPLRDYRTIRRSKEEPDQFGAAQWAFGKWRPDLIDFGKNEIFEIKPLRTAHYGILQLWRYTHNFNCALYFDWLAKPGAQGREMPPPLRLGRVTGDYFREVDPTKFLEEYFAARDARFDDSETSAKKKVKIPKKRQRARRSEVEAAIRAKGKLKVLPMIPPHIPGLVLYSVHSDKRDDDKPEQSLPVKILKVALVVTGVLVLATVVVGIGLLALGAAEGAGAIGIGTGIGSGIGAGVGNAVGVGQGVAANAGAVVEVFGAAVDTKLFAASAETIGNTFSALRTAGLLTQ